MKILINEIFISYFKGIRSLHLTLNSDITSIYGDNGTGKSTICDAILWTLFGRNSEGSAQFSIKTLDTSGNVIPNVRHSVKLSLSINGTPRDIEKVYVEEHVTRRGRITDEIKHSTEYYVDGESFTKKDYEAFITSIINESTFKAVTDPRYFHSLHWKEQRAFLEKLAGNIDYSPIENDPRFDEITHQSQFNSIDDYLTHLSYNIRQTKEKIDAIPLRIEEINMARPEPRDWDAIESEIMSISNSLNEKTETLYSLEHNAQDSVNQHLRQQIEFQRKRIDDMRISARNMADVDMADYNKKRDQFLQILSQKKTESHLLEQKHKSLGELIARAEESLNTLLAEKSQIHSAFDAVKAEKLSVSPDQLVCPTCGHPFDGDEREKVIADIKTKWVNSQQAKKDSLRQRNAKVNEQIADAQALIASYSAELDSINVNSLSVEVAEIEKKVNALVMPESADNRLALNPSYADAQHKIQELQAQLHGHITTDNSEAISNLKTEISNLNAKKEELSRLFAEKGLSERCLNRMTELENELLTLQKQYDKLLEKRELTIEYQSLRDNLLEESVNSKFFIVKFRLFDTLNDGTRKPNCICWVSTSHGLVPYADANSCSKINAGRDIINTISAYYDIYAPCITDNAESSNVLRPLQSQDIRLYVSHDKTLTIHANH